MLSVLTALVLASQSASVSAVVVRGAWHTDASDLTRRSNAQVLEFCRDRKLREYEIDGQRVFADPAAFGLLELEQKTDLADSLLGQVSDGAPYASFAGLPKSVQEGFRQLFAEDDFSNLTRHVLTSDKFNVFASPAVELELEYEGTVAKIVVPYRMLDREPFRSGAVESPELQAMEPPAAEEVPEREDRTASFSFFGSAVRPEYRAMLSAKISSRLDEDIQLAASRYRESATALQRRLEQVIGGSMADHVPMGKDGLSINDLSEDLRRLMSNPMWMKGLPAEAARDPDFLSKIRIKSATSALEIGVEVKVSTEQTANTKETFYMTRGITLPY